MFALNDRGQILTYFPYSRGTANGFAEAVERFAERLSSEMNCGRSSVGTVSTLVAKSWYDDGPVGNGDEALDWWGDQGMLQRLFRRQSERDVLPMLIRKLGRFELLDQLPAACGQQTARQSRVFLQAVIDEFREELNWKTRFQLAVSVDVPEITHQLFTRLPWSKVMRLLSRSQCDTCGCFHGVGDYESIFTKLAAFNPTIAVRVIRGGRPKRIQRDLDDRNAVRRKALATAHRQLGRTKLADQLLGVSV